MNMCNLPLATEMEGGNSTVGQAYYDELMRNEEIRKQEVSNPAQLPSTPTSKAPSPAQHVAQQKEKERVRRQQARADNSRKERYLQRKRVRNTVNQQDAAEQQRTQNTQIQQQRSNDARYIRRQRVDVVPGRSAAPKPGLPTASPTIAQFNEDAKNVRKKLDEQAKVAHKEVLANQNAYNSREKLVKAQKERYEKANPIKSRLGRWFGSNKKQPEPVSLDGSTGWPVTNIQTTPQADPQMRGV